MNITNHLAMLCSVALTQAAVAGNMATRENLEVFHEVTKSGFCSSEMLAKLEEHGLSIQSCPERLETVARKCINQLTQGRSPRVSMEELDGLFGHFTTCRLFQFMGCSSYTEEAGNLIQGIAHKSSEEQSALAPELARVMESMCPCLGAA